MDRIVRILLIGMGVIELVLAVGFVFQIPAAIGLWPFPGVSTLSYLLLGSAFATAATITLWPVVMREPSAIMGSGISHFFLPLPLAIFCLMRGAAEANSGITVFGVVMLLASLVGLGLMLYSRKFPFRDQRPLPAIARWSFIGFLIALAISGPMMVFRQQVLPWPLTPELSTIFGWLFIAAGVYYAYSLVKQGWANGAPPLAAFLTYDLILIVPLILRIPTLAPQYRISMALYLGALIYSAVLAVYLLFVNPKTRVIGTLSA